MSSELSGQIEHITYTNVEDGFTIARLKVLGRLESVTVLGKMIAPVPGETLRLKGEWVRHPVYGEQFRISSYERTVPATVEGIEKYLGSGMIRGLGPVMARRIVDRFGNKTLKVIDTSIERLAEVEGIGRKRIETIRSAWQDQREIRDVMIFLQAHGVSAGHAGKIFRRYGRQSVTVLTENPFRLATEIQGIGFLTADRIAAKLGFPDDSALRVTAGILYVLDKLSQDGHVYYPYDALVSKCRETLSVGIETVASAMADLVRADRIVLEELNPDPDDFQASHKAVYLKPYYVCETGIARRIHSLSAAPKACREMQPDRALRWVQQRLAIALAADQITAIRTALAEKLLVITGGPGTGKTTIVNALLQIFSKAGASVLLAAPTGRAAKRLGETCGREAVTIHRLLEFTMARGGFQRNEQNPLTGDLLVVDEASMIDTVLMHHLLKAVPAGATMILVGDVHQLPSVGPGTVLKDIIDSGTTAVVELKEIFRQASRSRIIVNAHRINSGQLPDLQTSDPPEPDVADFFFIQQEDPERVVEIILELTQSRIPRRFGLDPLNDIQVLTPMHRGLVGATNLNRRLQEELNPGQDLVTRGEQSFRVNDKVMQIRNNYEKEVFNGDIGRIVRIDPFSRQVTGRFDGREIFYEAGELEEIVPAYAISVHKSQGSEYPAVVIPVLTQHFLLLQRNLIYTAVTRGRKLVVMVGTRKALAIAVKNNTPQHRYTHLKYRLTGR
ncbi:MAG: recombinase RecD [Deltaproteobacteria bacterium SG8_13]|nr:MAG: recombinase RecD [Deltaproteobacteria bacterium SG8_13]